MELPGKKRSGKVKIRLHTMMRMRKARAQGRYFTICRRSMMRTKRKPLQVQIVKARINVRMFVIRSPFIVGSVAPVLYFCISANWCIAFFKMDLFRDLPASAWALLQ